ncbi:MAG: alpha/beta fold hydrolase [Acidimicrobiales bacterium]|jgi:pimeloyl-ACP methyl ester carboxylesterase
MAPPRARRTALSKRSHPVALALALALTVMSCLGGTLSTPATAATPAPTASAVGGGDASVTGALASFYRPPDPLPYAPAGSIIRAQRIPAGTGLPSGTRAYRVLYHSTSGSGGDLAESGIAVVPGGTPPPGGFPIVSWAHGTTGVASGCAPSLEGTATLPDLAALIGHRDIVVATDYRGLGAPGLHPYLVGNSEAEDVLDAARAARALVGSDASDDVVILGYSQGGQAALFAGEIAPSYAPDLYIAGVAAVAPVTSVLELAPSGDLPPPSGQSAFTAMVLFAWAHHYRTFGLRNVLTPAGLADLTAVSSSCVDAVASLYDAVPPAHFFLPGWEHDPAVQAANRANRPGGTPTSAPILVVQGSADEVVPIGETTEFVKQSLCRSQYDTVEYVTDRGAGHSQVMGISAGVIDRWIQARFAGEPTTDSCTRPGFGLSRTT